MEDRQEDSEDELRQKFINEMIKAGYDKNLAIKALEVIKPDEIDEGKFVAQLYKDKLVLLRCRNTKQLNVFC